MISNICFKTVYKDPNKAGAIPTYDIQVYRIQRCGIGANAMQKDKIVLRSVFLELFVYSLNIIHVRHPCRNDGSSICLF